MTLTVLCAPNSLDGGRVEGFGVWGLGLGVWGLGCGLWGVGRGVWGVGCEVWGVGCRVWGIFKSYTKNIHVNRIASTKLARPL